MIVVCLYMLAAMAIMALAAVIAKLISSLTRFNTQRFYKFAANASWAIGLLILITVMVFT